MSGSRKLALPATSEPIAIPVPHGCSGFDAQFEGNVTYSTGHGSQVALPTASKWAGCLGAGIVLWFPQIVSHSGMLVQGEGTMLAEFSQTESAVFVVGKRRWSPAQEQELAAFL
jgi:hypothetical protein